MFDILGAVLIGLICGGIASALVPGKTPGGLVGVTVVGILGSVIGKLVFGLVGLEATWFVGSILSGAAGAVVVLVALNQFLGKSDRHQLTAQPPLLTGRGRQVCMPRRASDAARYTQQLPALPGAPG